MGAPSPSTFPALVFLPPAGATPAEQWMAAARRACAADLVERLRAQGFSPLFLASGDPQAADALSAPDVELIAESTAPFHFGRALSQIVQSRRLTGLAYFGGASAPLATSEVLAGWRDQARQIVSDGALVNNLHSTDWAFLRDARCIVTLAERLPTDNALGWVLSREAGLVVEMPSPSTAARTDIDTPGDLALIRRHPDLGHRLKQALSPFPEDLERRVDGLARVLRSPAASLALIGRVSESAWREIVRRSEVWVRVFAEERGMRASGRLARGEVSSLLAELVERRGPAGFVARLGQRNVADLERRTRRNELDGLQGTASPGPSISRQ